jgi:hypothetical protein
MNMRDKTLGVMMKKWGCLIIDGEMIVIMRLI